MKKILLAIIGLSHCTSTGPAIAKYDSPTTALLLLDLQKDFLADDGRMPIARTHVDPLLDAVTSLVQQARARDALLVTVANRFSKSDCLGNLFRHHAAVEGSPGADFDPRLDLRTDVSFDKAEPDAFSNPALDAYLRQHQVDTLIIAGVFADQCVQMTVQAARNRHYRVVVVETALGASSDRARADAVSAMVEAGTRISPLDLAYDRPENHTEL